MIVPIKQSLAAQITLLLRRVSNITMQTNPPEPDPVVASVLEITNDHVCKLEVFSTPNNQGGIAAMDNRLTDLFPWADIVGAAVQETASLDWRFNAGLTTSCW